MYPCKPIAQQRQQGFSLIEMAIVMVILGMLLAGLLMPLSSQREVSQRKATERQLQEIRNALIGYAQANGHLPCPVSTIEQGVAPANPAACTAGATYFLVPYATLGMQGTIINNALVDVWQKPIHYRLTNINAWQYAKGTIPMNATAPDFKICSTSTGATGVACALGKTVASNVVAVVVSTGPNQNQSPSADENQNTDLYPDPIFVSQTPISNFDDILVWISQSSLIYELSRTGQ